MVDEIAAGSHLIIFTIAGVQSFVSQARRTQDLWVSSRILHIIGYKALEVAVDQLVPYLSEPEDLRKYVIYPHIEDSGTISAMPNRFIIITPSGVDARDFANAVHAAAINAWVALSEATLNVFAQFTSKPNTQWQTLWRQQAGTSTSNTAPTSPWLEFYWAAAPLDDDYKKAYDTAAKLLAARKQLRDFGHLPPQPGEKCTLNGTLSALSNDSHADRKQVQVFWEHVRAKVDEVSSLATLRRGERLCALTTIKRFAQDAAGYQDEDKFGKQRFPSTSTIAAAPFKVAVAKAWNTEIEAAFRALDSKLGECKILPVKDLGYPALTGLADKEDTPLGRFLRYDGDFIRAEGLTDEALLEYIGAEKENLQAYQGKFEAIRKAYGTFKTALPDTIAAPSSYYAIIMLDGDCMGETISNLGDRDLHQRFSEALSDFAANIARPIVEKPGGAAKYLATWNDSGISDEELAAIVPGRLIYSGGDDALAMVPAESALPIADALRRAFTNHMAAKNFTNLHMSGGIAIVHFTHPLEDALSNARSAEKKAKQKHGRDALCVTLLRRSGETREAALKWVEKDVESLPLIDLCRRAFLTADRLSSKVAYESLEIAEVLDQPHPTEKNFRDDMQPARRAEFLRLINRHTPNKKAYADLNKALGGHLADFAEHISGDPKRPASGWEMLANWLLIMRFLAKGE